MAQEGVLFLDNQSQSDFTKVSVPSNLGQSFVDRDRTSESTQLNMPRMAEGKGFDREAKATKGSPPAVGVNRRRFSRLLICY